MSRLPYRAAPPGAGARILLLLYSITLLCLPGAQAFDLGDLLDPTKAPFIPIPEIDISPNAGETVGVIPTVLETNDQGEITRIIAPDLLYNSYFGWGARGRIYDYPSDDEQWSVVGGGKERVEREFDGEYVVGRTREGLWTLNLSAIYDRSGTPRFWGQGNNTRPGAETNYTETQGYIQAQLDNPGAVAAAGGAAAAQEGDLAAATEGPAVEALRAEGPAGEAEHVDSGTASVTSTVIRGDHPAAAGLANVWLELRKTLAFLADTTPPVRRTRAVRATASTKFGSTRASTSSPEAAEETTAPGEGEETA